MTSNKLTYKQQVFADHYINTGNAMQSAKFAGYSDAIAKNATIKLLNQAKIKKYIDNQASIIKNKDIMDAKDVMEFLSSVISGKTTETTLISTPDGIERIEKPADIKTRISASRELLKRYPMQDELSDAKLSKLQAETRIKQARADEVEPDKNEQVDKEFSKLTEFELRKLAQHY